MKMNESLYGGVFSRESCTRMSCAWEGFSFLSHHELTRWKCGLILSSLFACFYPCMRVHVDGSLSV